MLYPWPDLNLTALKGSNIVRIIVENSNEKKMKTAWIQNLFLSTNLLHNVWEYSFPIPAIATCRRNLLTIPM